MTAPALPICEKLRHDPWPADDGARTEAADTIEALYEALEELADGYRSEADPYSCGGFCRNLDEDDCMVTALAALTLAREGAPRDQHT